MALFLQAAFVAVAPLSRSLYVGLPLQTSTSAQHVTTEISNARCTRCQRYLRRTTSPIMSARRPVRRDSRRGSYDDWPFGPFRNALQSAQIRWDTANSSERIILLALATAAAGGIGLAFNILMHLAAFTAFLVFPIFVLPLAILSASFGIVALTLVGVTGTGFFFLGAPFILGGALLSKVLAPLAFVILAVKASGMGRRKDDTASSYRENENKIFDIDGEEERHGKSSLFDAFSEFDRELALRTRSAFRTEATSGNLDEWTVQDCVMSLKSAGLSDAARVFVAERIDGHVLRLMSDKEIERELGATMTLGDRKRLVAWARNLRR